MSTMIPLWQQMQSAYFHGRHPGYSDRHGYAAELRCIADAIEARGERGEVADWLRAEAQRAEVGE